MAVEYKLDIDSSITERGIYLAELKVFHKDVVYKKEIVFARYAKERSINEFWKNHKLSQFGIRENNTAKQVVHLKITPLKYLSDVNIYTYNNWLKEQELKKQ